MSYALSALLVGFLLCAQAAFATRPCMESDMSAAMAVMQQDGDDCCDTAVSAANLCVAQCTDGDKLVAHPERAVPQRSVEVAFKVEMQRPAPPDWRIWLARSGRDPPKTIRCCSFLI